MINRSDINNHSVSISGNTFKADAKAPLAKPIEVVQNTIESVTDQLIPATDEEKKKSHKTAIAVGSSVLVLSALVGILNPKYSSKLINQLKKWQSKSKAKIKTNRHDTLVKTFYEACNKLTGGTMKVLEFSNNINSAKDLAFKWLFANPRNFSGMENKKAGSILKKINAGIAKVTKKPYEAVTRWFDNIGRYTVKIGYRNASGKMDAYENIVKEYMQKLPANTRAELEAKLKDSAKMREFFSENNVIQRVNSQESLMTNLEDDFVKKCINYKHGYRNRFQKKSEHAWNNMTFWAQDIMKPKRDILEKQGQNAVEKITGRAGESKGIYDEINDIIKPHLTEAEYSRLEKSLTKAKKVLQKANHNECVEYFDKKRDLVLGSAATDVLTAILGLGLSGVAITTADTKEDRTTRLVTGVFPIVAGLGASMAFTAMLFSGVKSMLMGAGTSVILSIIGNFANNKILGNNQTENQEVNNV